MAHRITRTAGTAALIAGALLLTACSSGGGAASTDTASSAGARSFSYTDYRGTTVKLDSIPKTLVAQSSIAAALKDAGIQVKGAYGELTPDKSGALSYQDGSLDLKDLTVVGSTYGEFDIDKYAQLNPSLLIDYSYDKKSLWYVPQAQADQVLALAPSIGVDPYYDDTDSAITAFVDLAGKLGADTAKLASAKKAYLAAEADAESAAKTSGLTAAFVSPSPDTLYVAQPTLIPEGNTLKTAGLDIVAPKNTDGQVFQQLSWEQTAPYQKADVLFVDARSYDATLAALKDVAAWQALPAVKAGQVYPWYASAPYSYQQYTKVYSEFATALGEAKDLG
jgi:iron complex transport system substrate-binding protein